MLSIGSFRSNDCAGMSRRAFVRAAWTAPFVSPLVDVFAREAAESATAALCSPP